MVRKQMNDWVGFVRNADVCKYRGLLFSWVLTVSLSFVMTAIGGSYKIVSDASGQVKYSLLNWGHGTQFMAGYDGLLSSFDERAWVQFPLTSAQKARLIASTVTGVDLGLCLKDGSDNTAKLLYVTDIDNNRVVDTLAQCGAKDVADDIGTMASGDYFANRTWGTLNKGSFWVIGLVGGDVLSDLDGYLNRSTQDHYRLGLLTTKDWLSFYGATDDSSKRPYIVITYNPGTPKNLTATKGTDENAVELEWDSVDGDGVRYTIYRSTSSSVSTAEEYVSTSYTWYNDSGADYGVTYYYWVAATDSVGATSSKSSSVSGYKKWSGPGITNGASDITPDSFTAEWDWGLADSEYYELDVSTSSSFASYVTGYKAKLVNDTECSVSELTPETTYYYRVREYVDGKRSANSIVQSVRTAKAERGTIRFSSSEEDVYEFADSITLSVKRTDGSYGTASVTVATVNGSAVSGTDFTAVSKRLSWANGEDGWKSVDIPILDDSVVENNESFSVVLSDVSGATLGTYSSCTVVILNDDLTTYTVSYDGNGYTGGSTPASQTKIQDLNLTLQTNLGNLAKTGYQFVGWNTKSSGSGTDYAEGGTYTANAAATLYAKWTPITYTVAYNGNGNTGGSTASYSHTYDTAKNLTANGFTKTGYTFAGWATSSSGSVVYSDGQSVLNLTSTQGATVTLYAKWTPITYTVSYNGNGNTGGSMASSSHTYDTAKNLTANGFTKTGYTFAGWAASSGGSVAYSDGQSVLNLTSTQGVTVTLYAKWTANGSGTAVRVISGTSVTVTVTPASGTSAWGAEETIPAGLTPANLTGPKVNWNATTRWI